MVVAAVTTQFYRRTVQELQDQLLTQDGHIQRLEHLNDAIKEQLAAEQEGRGELLRQLDELKQTPKTTSQLTLAEAYTDATDSLDTKILRMLAQKDGGASLEYIAKRLGVTRLRGIDDGFSPRINVRA
jgi:hypothetical protein